MPEDDSTQGNANAGSEGQGEPAPILRREAEEKNLQKQCGEKPYFSNKTKDLVSLLTVIAIAIYTCITILLWCNSTKQLAVTRDTEVRQLRAYLLAEPQDFEIKDGLPTAVYFVINNAGVTPASALKIFSGAQVLNYPFPETDWLPLYKPQNGDIPDPRYPNAIVVPASIAKDSNFGAARIRPSLTADQWDSLPTNHIQRLHIFGEISYRDIFDSERHLWFCSTLIGFRSKPTWQPCPGASRNRFD